MKYFSLFTGIGGFELGIKKATNNKWKCVGYSEIDKYAIQTFEKNFKGLKNYGDATKIKTDELPNFDLLCGGFPCQAFSIAGKRRGFNDTRGTLFFEIARIAKAKRPSYLLLENVKGLLNHGKGRTFRKIIQTISKLGYDYQWMVLNSKFFGVPQNRERVFIVGHLRGKPSTKIFPIGESSSKIDKIKKQVSSTICSQYYKQPRDQQYIIHSLFPRSSKTNKGGTGHLKKKDGTSYCLDGGNCQALEVIQVNQSKESGGKQPYQQNRVYDKEGLSPTLPSQLGGNRNHLINTNKLRRLTPVECERLQGFPDNWTEGVSDTQRYKQLGNAVTVNVIEAIIKQGEIKW